MKERIVLCLLCVASLVVPTDALYFVVRQAPQCFILDQPAQTTVVVGYKVRGGESSDVQATVRSTDTQKLIFEKTLDAADHFEFILPDDGQSTVCFVNNNIGYVKLDVSISYGQDLQYYQELAHREGMDDVTLDVTMLNDEMTMILNEADYMKDKEVEYHDDTEAMNTAAQWWPMLQLVILIITGVIQVNYLKTFFQNNKLI